MTSWWRRARLGGSVLFLAGCAQTFNLMDPASPRFDGRYASSPAPGRPGSPLRVVTFNIRLAKEIDRAIQVLQGEQLRGADVIALQEMDPAGTERIARALGLNYVYFPSAIHPVRHAYFGPAILSPWPIEDESKLLLPHEGKIRHQRRTATVAQVTVRGLPIRVYAVHLETQIRISERDRADQVHAILDDADRFTGPVVIAGDFNSSTAGAILARAGFSWTTARVGPSVSIFSWDHIFVRGLLPVTGAGEAGVVRQVLGASDHHPVWSVVVPTAASVAAAPVAANP
jgi:endonuclease/exonuclease/phosphatase family metal-dependent hydrolase